MKLFFNSLFCSYFNPRLLREISGLVFQFLFHAVSLYIIVSVSITEHTERISKPITGLLFTFGTMFLHRDLNQNQNQS